MNTNSYKNSAQVGESLRMVGQYSGAIEQFTAAIKDYRKTKKKTYYWAYAHRAAANSALGDYEQAIKDFLVAHEHYEKYNPAWILAQEGEMFRLWARGCFVKAAPSPKSGKLKAQITTLLGKANTSGVGQTWPVAIDKHYLPPKKDDSFETIHSSFQLLGVGENFFLASNAHVENPWTHAHLGAIYTMRCWVGLKSQRFGLGGRKQSPDFEKGDKHFSDACRLNSAYGWAYAFHAILAALYGDAKKALELIGKAQMSGIDRQVPLMRMSARLSLYQHQTQVQARKNIATGAENTQPPQPSQKPGQTTSPDQSEKDLEQGVQYAWSLLQLEPDEAYARYYVANGLRLRELSRKEASNTKAVNTKAAINRAREEVISMRGQALAMEGGLACLEENYKEAELKLQEINSLRSITGQRVCDLETLSMLVHDPAWAAVREPQGQSLRNKDLMKAHKTFKELFDF